MSLTHSVLTLGMVGKFEENPKIAKQAYIFLIELYTAELFLVKNILSMVIR